MKLVQFMRTVPVNSPVWINPSQVIAVDQFGANTRIHTTAAYSDVAGGVELMMVTGTPLDAVLKLQAALE